MSDVPSHLVERAARRLGGLTGVPGLTPRHSVSASATSGFPSSAVEPLVSQEALHQAGMMPWGRRRDLLTEEFRIGQAALLRTVDAAEATRPGRNLVMVTSARPGEGKSFIALNLAGSIAHYAERPTLLVDVDAKECSVTHHLGLSSQPGLLDVAKGSVTLSQAVQTTSISRLSILPIGAAADRAAASAEQPLGRVVEQMGQIYRDSLILLDLPPCLSRSEASLLAPLAGHALLVVEAQSTQRSEVELALDLIEACPSVSLLLNKVRPTGRDSFGRYGQYS